MRCTSNASGSAAWVAALCCLIGQPRAGDGMGAPRAVAEEAVAQTRGTGPIWPRWRGPNGGAVCDGTPLPVRWNEDANVHWKTAIDEEGFSSPVVFGERVFVTSAKDLGALRSVHCLDRSSGALLWTRTIEDDNPEIASSMTGHAAATPATDGTCVVACFGRAGLVCCEPEGELRWRLDLGKFESELGLASSPIIEGSTVYVVCDHDGDRFRSFDSYLAAVDLRTGELVWKVERPGLYRSWSTPIVVPGGEGRPVELIVSAQDELRAYDPAGGGLLWRAAGMTGWVAPTPVCGGGLVYAASGPDGPVMAVRPGGRGDVTASHVAWCDKGGGPYVCSPLLYRGRLYVHGERGVLTCYDAATGRVEYRRRLAGKFIASGVAGDGKLYLTNDEATTYVIAEGSEFRLLAQNRLGEYCLASPAIAAGRLLIRTQHHLYSIGGEPGES